MLAYIFLRIRGVYLSTASRLITSDRQIVYTVSISVFAVRE